MLKLKGRFSKKLKKEDKKKKEETLKHMQETRDKDDQHLREILKNKLVWVTGERQKGINLIEETKVKVYKLAGMMMLINDVLNPKKEEK